MNQTGFKTTANDPVYRSKVMDRNQVELKNKSFKEKCEELEEDVKAKAGTIEFLNEKVKSAAGFELRIKELEKEKTELDNTFQPLVEDNKVKAATIEILNAKVAEALQEAEKYKNLNSVLEKRLLATLPDLNLVERPTACDLSKLLEELAPLITDIKKLSKKINTLRDHAETTYETIGIEKPSSGTLQKLLDAYDLDYDLLVLEYFKFIPKGKEALLNLQKQIDASTHKTIPAEHVRRMSAIHYLQSDTMKINEDHYADLLSKCTEIRKEFAGKLRHTDRRYDDAARHLNDIDSYIGYQGTTGFLSYITPTSLATSVKYCGNKDQRISPTISSYQIEEEKEAEKVAEVITV